MSDHEMTVFRVLRSEETRVDVNDPLMGYGVQFPDGSCYCDWNRQAYPEDHRLDHPHVSFYGSLDDVEQGTGGTVETITTVDAE